jgi:hypothetical protein
MGCGFCPVSSVKIGAIAALNSWIYDENHPEAECAKAMDALFFEGIAM